jgi:2-polyprenyl-3-methyl-5-hydroxy-6-metoxy-1,4-benzoquinol methylase
VNSPFDLVIGGVPRFAAEAPWARRLIERHARRLSPQTRTDAWARRPVVADAAGTAPHVLVHVDPEAYLPPAAALRLLQTLDRAPLALPVTNEPWCEEARFAPSFAYHTPSMLEEAAAHIAAAAGAARPLREPRSPVFAARREVLESLDPDLPLDRVPEEVGRRGVEGLLEPASYLHRYGEMDGQAREDLAGKIPRGARSVLDVGCSRGATARLLRLAGVSRVVGIEPDPGDAGEAARACDLVLPLALEAVSEEFPEEFDAILFGDVLEHLPDPSDALSRVRPWLSSQGVVVASVPNLGHWSIVSELLEGRFDYIPYSILSGTHIRFFTRATLTELFEACGYRVESIDVVTFPISPAGALRLEKLRRLPGASDDLEVVEFLAVAKARSDE